MKKKYLVAVTMAMAGMIGAADIAMAGVSAEEAAALKTTLTPMGAEKAGNADGTIPAWAGGYDGPYPAEELKKGDRRWNPFADEKPLFSITKQNMDQYADKLTDGMKAVLASVPGYRMDVYPTHRTASAPDWVYENTFKNATEGSLVGDGDGVAGSFGGIPFPIPKNGYEVRWNQCLRWRGEGAMFNRTRHSSVTEAGDRVLGSQTHEREQVFFYNRSGTSPADFDDTASTYLQFGESPAFRAGEGLLSLSSTDFTKKDSQSWQYLVGQRRVRRAPSIGHDTPDFVNSGVNFFDEVFGGNCDFERFEMKLVGKKEIYIPYNNNRLLSATEDEVFGENSINPDLVRWELHRVWVVEATVKPGQRHAVARRMFYQDEDTWGTSVMEGWDASGAMWKASVNPAYLLPDMPGVMASYTDFQYNLLTQTYSARNLMFDPEAQMRFEDPLPLSYYSPDSLQSLGVR